MPSYNSEIDIDELPLFDGPGEPGIVPDPITASNRFLRDDGSWTDIDDIYVNQSGDTMTGNLIMDDAELRVINSAGTIEFIIGFDTATGAPTFRRTGTGGTLVFMPDAQFPQLLLGSAGGGTTDAFIDSSPGGSILHINDLNNGLVRFGRGGIAIEETGGGTDTITFFAPSDVTVSYDIVFPDSQGGAETALINDGSGNLTWGDPVKRTGTWLVSRNATNQPNQFLRRQNGTPTNLNPYTAHTMRQFML